MSEQLKPKTKLKTSLLFKSDLPKDTDPTKIEKESSQKNSDQSAFEFAPPYVFESLAVLYDDTNTYHSACIRVKAAITVLLGYSIYSDEKDKKEDEDYKKIDAFMKQSLIDFYNTQLDFEIFGNGYGELTRNLKKEVAEYFHIPAKETVLTKQKESMQLKQIFGSKTIHYNEFQGDKYQKSEEHEYIHLKNYSPKSRYYGVPEYMTSVTTMFLDQSANEFNVRKFNNNAVPDSIIEMYGFDSEEGTSSNIKNFFQGNFKGTENSGKVLLLEAETKGENEIIVTKMGAEIKEASFRGLRTDNREEVLVAHGVPPRLLGLESVGKLGGGGEVKEQLKLFNEIKIIPRQNNLARIINNIIEKGMGITGWKIKFNTFEFANTVDDATFYNTMITAADANGETILDASEARSEMGYPPREETAAKKPINKADKFEALAKQLKQLRITLESMRDE